MNYLVIRHAKTDANRLTRALFGKTGAPVNDEGKQQIEKLRLELLGLNINLDIEPVAVSELMRTNQTAELAGFSNITINPLLNEVNTADPKQTLELVAQGKLPEEAITAANALLANPPKQKIWVTHGLVMAGLLEVLGLADTKDRIPKHCEIVEIDFSHRR